MIRVFCLLLAGFLGFTELAANENTAGEELELLRGKIDGLQQRLGQARQQTSTISETLENIEKETLRLNLERKKLNERLETLTVRRMQQNVSLFKLNQQLDVAKSRIDDLARTSFMLAQTDGLKLVLNEGDSSEKLRSLVLLRYMVASSNQSIAEIHKLQQQHKQALAGLESQQQKMDQVLKKLNQNAKNLKSQSRDRKEKRVLLQNQVEKDQNQVEVFRQREKELEILLTALRQASLENRSSEKFSRQTPEQSDKHQIAAKQTESSKEVGSLADSQPNEAVQLNFTGFGKNKGKLEMPVKGELRKKFGQVRPESGLKWDGLMLDVPLGETVTAIYGGQVVFSDWFGSFGQLLVIDHGEGFMSLYGHNQVLHVALGGKVQVGQRIASAGNTGGLQRPGLYFEIRDNGIPADPLQWCRL